MIPELSEAVNNLLGFVSETPPGFTSLRQNNEEGLGGTGRGLQTGEGTGCAAQQVNSGQKGSLLDSLDFGFLLSVFGITVFWTPSSGERNPADSFRHRSYRL